MNARIISIDITGEATVYLRPIIIPDAPHHRRGPSFDTHTAPNTGATSIPPSYVPPTQKEVREWLELAERVASETRAHGHYMAYLTGPISQLIGELRDALGLPNGYED